MKKASLAHGDACKDGLGEAGRACVIAGLPSKAYFILNYAELK